MTAQVLPMSQPEEGWLYVIENPSIPGMVKVGQTTRTPQERAVELHVTGTPTPFDVAHAWPVQDVTAAERAAHAALRRFRVSTDREWFSLPSDRAVALLEPVLGDDERPRSRPFRIVRGMVEGVGWLTLIALVLSAFRS
ncbi:GIY-YIG nuclease family protein [Tabrizicola sp.]|uniref:GIY-YIG nuclease family protein n=1 Tax=Tabrizicola sp. TaxID=2005166 RepID=UPI0025D1704A|nr:GIY-YIG nuclease family protein [Tabrizicola sp.]